MSTVARKVTVHGRVQGVFFRDSCRRQAEDHGVVGWVSNEPDGSVAAWFEGEQQAVEAMLAWVHEGPPHAKVHRVDVSDVQPQSPGRFSIR
jgi:acylphosphatase